MAYIIKGGEPVRLAAFGERSVLQSLPGEAGGRAAARPRSKPAGRIYTTASLGTDAAGRPVQSVVAVNPESGKVTKVFDKLSGPVPGLAE